MADQFSKYIEFMSKDLGLDAISEQERNEIISDLGQVILERSLVVVFERLTNDDRAELERLSAKEGPELMIFLRQRIPDFDTIVAETSREIIAGIKAS